MHPFPLVLFGILCIFGIAFFSTNHWMPVFKEFKSNKLIEESKPYLDGTFSDSFASIGTEKARIAKLLEPENIATRKQYYLILCKSNPALAIQEWCNEKNLTDEEKFVIIEKITEIAESNKGIIFQSPNIFKKGFLIVKGLEGKTLKNLDHKKMLSIAEFYRVAGEFEKAKEVLVKMPESQNPLPEVIFTKTKIAHQNKDYSQSENLLFELGKIAEREDKSSLEAIRHLCLLHDIQSLSNSDLMHMLQLVEKNPQSGKIDYMRVFSLLYKNSDNPDEKKDFINGCAQIFDLESTKELLMYGNWLMKMNLLREVTTFLPSFKAKMNQELFVLRSNALLLLGDTQLLKEELSNCPVIPTRWRLTIEARIHNLTGELESAHETLNKLYAFLGNDSTLLRTTCSYYEKVRDIGCLLYLLEKIKTIAVHKKYATNRLLIYNSESAPIERLIQLTSDLCSMEENNKDLKQTLLYYKLLDPTLSPSSKSFEKLLLEAKKFKKILANPQSRITLALAFLRKGSPGSALLELGEDHKWSEWQYERPGWFWIALKTFELNSIDSSLGQTSLLNSTISRAERECFVAIFGPN